MKAREIMKILLVGWFAVTVHSQEENSEYSGFLEVYSLSHAEAGKLVSGVLLENEIYEEITGNEDVDDRLVECLFFRQAEGDREMILSVEELIYGSEGDPPELPNTLKLDKVKGPRMMPTDSTFTAFETRNVGFSWDLALISEIDLEVNPRSNPIREVTGNLHDKPVDKARENSTGKNKDTRVVTVNKVREVNVNMYVDWTVLQEKVSLAKNPNNPVERPLAHKWMPRFKSLQVAGEFTVIDGVPALLRIERSPRDSKEMVVIFLTVKKLQ